MAPKHAAPTKAEQQTNKGKLPSNAKEQTSTTTPLTRAESKDRPKPSGKLDWSKAKTKDKEPVAERAKEEKKLKVEPHSPAAIADSATSKKTGLETKKLLVLKSATSGVVSGDNQKVLFTLSYAKG